ncbi:hypothetical protein HYU12_01240 [Candidatus Woesearchaeota archaeon]|nr:hypothetical protein [Candidatus Woesearchaeota archaeon]
MKKRLGRRLRYRFVPLSGAFMLTSILGFLIVAIYTAYGRIDLTWGFTLGVVFVTMFIASVVSITPSFPSELDNVN